MVFMVILAFVGAVGVVAGALAMLVMVKEIYKISSSKMIHILIVS